MTTMIAASSTAPVRLNADARVSPVGYVFRCALFMGGVVGLFAVAGL
ncbi:hypothetical protein [Rhodovarius crocodyli]|nr:hypothetical protein [Rhodovarius crocodyli]